MAARSVVAGCALWAVSCAWCVPVAAQQTPTGVYVVNEAANEQSTATAYASGLTLATAYANDVDGHAIFVPLAQILPSVTTWGSFQWDWTYVDTLIGIARANNKKFSLELEMGFQSGSTYTKSLPGGFAAACGGNCAPLFDVWVTGGSGGRCTSAYVPLPWNTNVQQMWSALATALAQHLKATGVYNSLTLVHVPGLSVYDEELRLPSGLPAPASTDTTVCPDGRLATTAVAADVTQARWQSLGYSDSAVISGFGAIAQAFANAFPDRYLGLSLLNPGPKGVDFPNFTGDAPGYVASQLVKEVAAMAPGRVQVQADDLDTDFALAEVTNLATQYGTSVGWQTNKHSETGAACGGAPCVDVGQTGTPYVDIMKAGSQPGGRYLEAWSNDVVNFPLSFAGGKSSGYFPSPQSGWWWDPKLNGTGFFIEYGGKSGNGIFIAGFLYDASGNNTWLVSTAQLNGATYASPWLKASGGQTLLGGYKAPSLANAGGLTIAFTDSAHAVMTRPDGTQVNLQRFSFTASATPVVAMAGAPQSGWWWAGSAYSGTGFGIEIQGNGVFIVAYVYDDAGNPVWYLATGTLTSPTSYSGTWDVYAGGPQLTSPEGNYSATKVAGKSVPMSLTFSGATHGTLTMGSVAIPIVRFQEY
jgi:hypothetical protein